ncbi:hypothetical protein ACN55_17595 [Escherichia coli]|nr:hypothetical protein ACN55_17595 [Escherichia coli]OKT13022.1 hypothetical protein ACN59_21510 [Escherichia coli]
MLPSETMIWQPEFTDKTLSRKPGAVQSDQKRENPATNVTGGAEITCRFRSKGCRLSLAASYDAGQQNPVAGRPYDA